MGLRQGFGLGAQGMGHGVKGVGCRPWFFVLRRALSPMNEDVR